jgi:hypothetical protein
MSVLIIGNGGVLIRGGVKGRSAGAVVGCQLKVVRNGA